MSTHYVDAIATIDLSKVEAWEIEALLEEGLSLKVEGRFATFLTNQLYGEGGWGSSSKGMLLQGMFEKHALSVTLLSESWSSDYYDEADVERHKGVRRAYEAWWEGVCAARDWLGGSQP